MSDKIEEIRARHKRLEDMRSSTYPDEISDNWTYFGSWAAHHDRSYLLAEVDRQRAEIERLRAENKKMHAALYRIAGKVPFADDPWTIARKALEGKP